jgi:hypothetical protein
MQFLRPKVLIMTDREFYPDLSVQYESQGKTCLAGAEWREDRGQWVCESEDFVIRLWPDSAGAGGVDFNGHLFNRHSKQRYRAARNALVNEARDLVK